MTAPALVLDGSFVARQEELARLEAVLDAAVRRGGECVLIRGVPGVGKSALMQAFGAEVTRRGGVFAYGRHPEEAGAPYAAWSQALGSLVREMDGAAVAERDRWRSDVGRGISAMADAVAGLVPGLDTVLGATQNPAEPGAADVRRRLQRAVLRLVSVTASYRLVVLALDDLQWADHDSLLLLSELLAPLLRNVVFLGAHRTDGFDPGSVDLGSADRCEIDLGPLSTAGIEELLGGVTGRTEELGRVATEFHQRTGGVPLRVGQLFRQATRAGAVREPGGPGPAAWDLGALESIGSSAADPAGVLDVLDPSDRAVVSALGCIGGEFDLVDAGDAAARPADAVARAVWSALDLGLLEALDRGGRRLVPVIGPGYRYRFTHDRMAEAARTLLSDDDRRDVQLRLGRALVDRGDGRLFEVARHLGAGGVRSHDEAERARWAEVLGRAARAARAQASFPLALECCRNGLALLGPRRWSTRPVLTRELQLAGAEAACLAADVAVMDQLLDEADGELDDPADRARIALLRVRGLVAANRLQDALDTGVRALAELGEPLPARQGKLQVAATLVRMRLTMRGWDTERLLALPPCADRRVSELQLILEQLRNVSFGARPTLFPLVVRKMLELALAHGLVPSSPTALASYGVLLVVTGDHAGSQRFGEVGLQLAEREEFRDAWPQAVFLHVNFIRHWRHPIADGLVPLREAVRVALDRGDQEYAGYLTAVLLYQSFWIGRPLPDIDALARSIVPEIRSQPVPVSLCRSTQQLCLNLMGRSRDPFLLAGESGYDEREVLPAARREQDDVALCAAALSKLGLHFWFADAAGAVPVADEVGRHLAGVTGTPNVPFFHLVDALSRIAAAPDARSTARAVRRSLALHRTWAAGAPANYAAPGELLAGVWARAQGDLRAAEAHLDQAIALAERHRLPLMSALAHEESGELHARTGRSSLGELMTREAHQRWIGLGMAARRNRLEERHPWLLDHDLVRHGSGAVDPVGVHRLLQALPAADSGARVAEILLGAVAVTTGAARVLLLVGDAGDLTVRAVHAAGATVALDPAAPDVAYDRAVVDDAARTGRPVFALAAAGLRPDAGPPAVPVSLAVPVRLRDRTIGVVHAEHDGPAPVLGPEHEETLAVLCAQAAAPLWSFELEQRLRAAEDDRSAAHDAQARFVPHELLRLLDVDDLGRVRSGDRVERPMTVLISDIRGYTALLEEMSPGEASELTTGFLRAVELPIIANHGVLQDVRGDEILAVFDAEPDDAVRAGLAMLHSLREHNRERVARGSEALRVGIGINTGTVGIGLVGGVNRMVLTVLGDAVNLASRIESATKRYASTLLISEQTRDRLADPDRFDIRRMERVMVVNRRRPVTIHEVYDEDPEPLRAAKRAAQPAFDEAFARFDAGDGEGARAAFERCRVLLPDDQVAALHLAHCEALIRGDLAGGQEIPLQRK